LQQQRLVRKEGIMRGIKKSSVLVAVSLGTFVSSAHAQARMLVKVPSPFVVSHQEFLAGEYDIRRRSTTTD
jgi:hypothetical protein